MTFNGVAKCGASLGRPFLWGHIIVLKNGEMLDF